MAKLDVADAEAVAGHVIRSQEVHAADGRIEVVAVVAVDCDVDGGAPKEIERGAVFFGEHGRLVFSAGRGSGQRAT